MVVGDDDVQPELAGARDLGDSRDPTVDGDHEVDTVGGELLDGLEREPIALVEPARQAPLDAGAELLEDQDADRGGGDAVDVVVAVHADPLTRVDRGADSLDRGGHVAERERVVARRLGSEERARNGGFLEPTADEDGRRDLAQPELLGERRDAVPVARSGAPAATLHRPADGTGRVGRR